MAIAAGAAWTFNCTIDLERPERHFVDNCELVHEFGHLLPDPDGQPFEHLGHG